MRAVVPPSPQDEIRGSAQDVSCIADLPARRWARQPILGNLAEHASTALSAGLIAVAGHRGALRRHLRARRQLPVLGLVAVAGVAGDLAYAAASQYGALSIVSALSSLYPVITVALGIAIQGHRAGRVQTAGITLALLGAVLLGAATH